jgi:hypothetical protein
MRYLLYVAVMLIAGPAVAMGFSEIPNQSIDEMIAACYSDPECKEEAEATVPIYSKESNTREPELRATLTNCLANQGSMNECVGFLQSGIEVEMSLVLKKATNSASTSCKSSVEKQQARWTEKTQRYCAKKATKETEGGSAWGGIEMSCNIDALKKRITAFRKAGECSPCSKCLHLL